MKEFFKDLRNDKTITLTFTINAILLFAIIIIILFSYANLPPFVPIFNQLPWGEKRLGNTITIFIPFLTAILIFAINLVASTLSYKRIPLASRMLAATSLISGIITFLFTLKTIILIL